MGLGIDDFPPPRPRRPSHPRKRRRRTEPRGRDRRLGTPNDVRELEDRLVAAESAAAALRQQTRGKHGAPPA